MNRNPTDVVAAPLDLPDVHAGADLDTSVSQSVAQARAATQRIARTIEGDEQPVTGRVDESSTVSVEDALRDRVMDVERRRPPPISQFDGSVGRSDDVG